MNVEKLLQECRADDEMYVHVMHMLSMPRGLMTELADFFSQMSKDEYARFIAVFQKEVHDVTYGWHKSVVHNIPTFVEATFYNYASAIGVIPLDKNSNIPVQLYGVYIPDTITAEEHPSSKQSFLLKGTKMLSTSPDMEFFVECHMESVIPLDNALDVAYVYRRAINDIWVKATRWHVDASSCTKMLLAECTTERIAGFVEFAQTMNQVHGTFIPRVVAKGIYTNASESYGYGSLVEEHVVENLRKVYTALGLTMYEDNDGICFMGSAKDLVFVVARDENGWVKTSKAHPTYRRMQLLNDLEKTTQ